ncbi:MAG: NAD(P)/FAD-dependent oxidoreductase [Deltaproteobacteria bacterium]|nr:NAD(P)/FAD-dependent oxidoreductase [Deltaproteobacteria bacterium]
MSKKRHLIVGCGAAALSALKQIRKLGSDDEVQLVTMEDYLPYSPMSLPYLVSGRRKEEEITIADNDFFKKMNATLTRGRCVTKIDPGTKKVMYDDGESDSYDTLLIASGSEPILQPALTAAKISGFHVMDDYVPLKEHKDNIKTTILGAGFVGMELAVSLAERGHEITVIAPRERILRLYFDKDLDDIIIGLFAKHGIRINRQWGEVSEVRNDNRSFEIFFESGQKTDADLVIAATGVRPRVSFLNGSGIRINEGVVVDRRMETSIPGVFAAGDVAEAANYLTGKDGLSLIRPSAVEQGKVAGSNMIGKEARYDGWLSMNAFNFFGHFACSIGEFMGTREDDILVQKDEKNRHYGKIVCRDGRLVGANFFNMDIDGGVLQYLIRNRIDVGPQKKLLLEKPKEAGLWFMHEAERKVAQPLEHQVI